MNIKSMMISIIIITMMAGGLTIFFTSTAQKYGVDIGQASQLNDSYDQYSTIYKEIYGNNETGSSGLYGSITSINIANPLSWLNVFPIIISVFKITFLDLPAMATAVITSTINMNTGLMIPNWLIFGVELIVAIIIIWEILSYLISGSGSST